MFIYEKVMPNGSVAKFHTVEKYEVHKNGTHAVVNSYHSEEMNIISWQDTYLIPPTIVIKSLSDVEFLLTYHNAPFDGGVIVEDEFSSIESIKARKYAEIKIKRNNVEWQGVKTPLGIMDSDPESQRKIFAKMTEAIAFPDSFNVQWRMKNNSIVEHNAVAMIDAGRVIAQHISLCQERKENLDQQVASAMTEDDVKLIDIESGWPT